MPPRLSAPAFEQLFFTSHRQEYRARQRRQPGQAGQRNGARQGIHEG